jgi:hypothetical protein
VKVGELGAEIDMSEVRGVGHDGVEVAGHAVRGHLGERTVGTDDNAHREGGGVVLESETGPGFGGGFENIAGVGRDVETETERVMSGLQGQGGMEAEWVTPPGPEGGHKSLVTQGQGLQGLKRGRGRVGMGARIRRRE